MRRFAGGILAEANIFSPVPTGLSNILTGHDSCRENEESSLEPSILTRQKQQIKTRDWQSVPSICTLNLRPRFLQSQNPVKQRPEQTNAPDRLSLREADFPFSAIRQIPIMRSSTTT